MDTIVKHFEIVLRQMHKLTHAETCFMNTDGVIVCSTNEARVGQYHPFSKKLVDEGLLELVVTEDYPEKRVKKGVHSAVRLNGTTVGVIGMSGEPEQILLFSKVVRELTEIMLQNSFVAEQQTITDHAINAFIYDCIFHNSGITQGQYELQGRLLGLNMKLPRAMIAFRFKEFANLNTISGELNILVSKMVQYCKQRITDKEHIVFQYDNDIIYLLPCERIHEAYQFAENLKRRMEEESSLRLGCGIGPIFSDISRYPACFEHVKILVGASCAGEGEVLAQEYLSPKSLVSNISPGYRQEYFDSVFQNCSREEYRKYARLLSVYFQTNGSVAKTADQLHIHKNTVQYQLDRIREKIHYDPRDLNDSFCIYLALLCGKDVEINGLQQ